MKSHLNEHEVKSKDSFPQTLQTADPIMLIFCTADEPPHNFCTSVAGAALAMGIGREDIEQYARGLPTSIRLRHAIGSSQHAFWVTRLPRQCAVLRHGRLHMRVGLKLTWWGSSARQWQNVAMEASPLGASLIRIHWPKWNNIEHSCLGDGHTLRHC